MAGRKDKEDRSIRGAAKRGDVPRTRGRCGDSNSHAGVGDRAQDGILAYSQEKPAPAMAPAQVSRCSVLARQVDHVVGKVQCDFIQRNTRHALLCDDGNGNIVFTKEIEHTDFPLDEITLYFANNVIHLPSEY